MVVFLIIHFAIGLCAVFFYYYYTEKVTLNDVLDWITLILCGSFLIFTIIGELSNAERIVLFTKKNKDIRYITEEDYK